MYKGLWVDGGMLNNFPIHAFDDREVSNMPVLNNFFDVEFATTKANTISPFNENVMGFRIKGAPETADPLKEDPMVLGTYAGALINTFMYSGGDGQIRSSIEEENTVYLNAFLKNTDKDKDATPYLEIAVTDFASASLDRERNNERMAGVKERLIEDAKNTTSESFE